MAVVVELLLVLIAAGLLVADILLFNIFHALADVVHNTGSAGSNTGFYLREIIERIDRINERLKRNL